MRLIAVILLQTFFSLQLFAQTDEKKKYSIKGIVTDEKGKLIDNCNILLYNSIDSSQVSATVSDEKGKFDLSVIPGSYYIKMSFLSYEEKIISAITINDKDVDVGSVSLQASAKVLSEVVVTSEKKLMELQLDKRVYNVSQDVSNIGANASEILGEYPFSYSGCRWKCKSAWKPGCSDIN